MTDMEGKFSKKRKKNSTFFKAINFANVVVVVKYLPKKTDTKESMPPSEDREADRRTEGTDRQTQRNR